jgi:hypothetical protein
MARITRLDHPKICAVGCSQAVGAARLWAGQASPSLPEVSLRSDMHGPEAVLMHVPHITETTSTRLTHRWVHHPPLGKGTLFLSEGWNVDFHLLEE